MKPKLSPSTERQILKLEKRAFKLERELAGVNAKWKKKIESLQAKHEKDITKLQGRECGVEKESDRVRRGDPPAPHCATRASSFWQGLTNQSS